MANNEFDPSDYPEQMGCTALPQIRDGYTEVEVSDMDEDNSILEVPEGAVKRMPGFNISSPERLPGEVRELLRHSAGVGMLACRIVERHDDEGFLVVELPSTPNPITMNIAIGQLVRRVYPKEN